MKTSKLRIAIMGAGAIGSVIGGMLARKGHKVTLVGRKPHMDAIAETGLHISGIWGTHTVLDLTTALEPPGEHQDIIFLTVKSFDTEKGGLEALRMAGPETVIVSIQNGLGNVETLIEIAGKDRIIGGMAIFGAAIIEPIASETLIGEIDGSNSVRVNAIAHLLDSAGIPTKTSENIMRDIWHKVLYNIALNPLSALFQVPYGEIADNPHTRWLAEQMISEAFMVAEASDQDMGISRNEYLDMLWNWKLPPTRDHKSSMLQDIMRHKRTEIDHINGAVVKLGAQYGIETPYNSAIVIMVKARETLGKK
jgi:2-dehydropantoate 2-reductase